MGISMKSIRGASKQTIVTWGEEKAAITYRPGAVTPALLDEIFGTVQGGKEQESYKIIVPVLLEMLIDWEVTDDAGAVVPISKDTLSHLPIPFLSEILTSVQADMSPGEASGSLGAG